MTIIRMKILITFFLISLLSSINSFAQSESSEPPLTSPYFIDGLHCKGLKTSVIGWPYTEAESKEIMEIELQKSCESLFKSEGIELYQWYTPEDLEAFSNQLKKSQDYKEALLEVKKSELKNHVHLFMILKPNNENKKTFKFKEKYYPSNRKDKLRQFSEFNFEWQDNEYVPLKNWSIGINNIHTNSDSKLDLSRYYLTNEESSRFSISNYQLADFYFVWNFPNVHFFTSSVEIHFLNNNINSSGKFNLDSSVNLKFGKKQKTFRAHNEYGLVVELKNYKPFSEEDSLIVNSSSTKNIDQYYSGLYFNTQFGNKYANFIKLNLSFLTSLNSNSSMAFMSYDFRKALSTIIDQFYFTGDFKYLKNIDAPEYRMHLPTRNETEMELGVAKNVQLSNNNFQLSGFLGLESIEGPEIPNTVDPLKQLYINNAFTGFRITYQMLGWDIQGQISIHNTRNF